MFLVYKKLTIFIPKSRAMNFNSWNVKIFKLYRNISIYTPKSIYKSINIRFISKRLIESVIHYFQVIRFFSFEFDYAA